MYSNNLDVSNDYLLDDYSSFTSNENACSLNIPMLREAIFKSKTNNKNYFIIGDLLSRTKTSRNSGIYEETEFLKQQLGDSLIQKYIVRPTDTLKSVYDRLCPNSFTNQGVSLYDAYVNYVLPDLPPMNDDVLNKMIQKAKDSGQKVYFKRVSDYTLSDSNFRTESQNNNEIGLLRLYGLDVDSRAANTNDSVLTLSNRLYGRSGRTLLGVDTFLAGDNIVAPTFQSPLPSRKTGTFLAGDNLVNLVIPTLQGQPQIQQPTFQATFSEPIPVVRGGGVSSSNNIVTKTFVFLTDYKDFRPSASSTGAISVKDYKKGDFAEFEFVRNESQSEPPMFALTPLGNRIGYGGRGEQIIQEVTQKDSLEKTTEDKMKINPAILIVVGIVLLGGILYITKK